MTAVMYVHVIYVVVCLFSFFFFFNDTATTEIYTLSLHDALPILFFCLGTEGSEDSLFRNGWFQWFSVWELKVPKVPYLEMGGSNVFLFKIGRAHV